MSIDAIPAGGGFADAIKFLSNKENISRGAASAADWVLAALEAVRRAAEPNPWKDSTDEEIATYLLEEIEKRDRSGV